MRLTRVSIALALAAFAGACGGGGDGGGPVTPPVTVTLGSIVPSVTTLAITAGQGATITMRAVDTNGQTIASASGYSYTSSATTVAIVSGAGVVTGLTSGNATITVSLTLNGVTKDATVTVTVSGALPSAVTVAAGASTNDFQPASVALARNGTVTWTFGALAHNVEFGGGGAPANIPSSTNTSVTRTFTTAGNFAYTCTLHANMNGTVLVP